MLVGLGEESSLLVPLFSIYIIFVGWKIIKNFQVSVCVGVCVLGVGGLLFAYYANGMTKMQTVKMMQGFISGIGIQKYLQQVMVKFKANDSRMLQSGQETWYICFYISRVFNQEYLND